MGKNMIGHGRWVLASCLVWLLVYLGSWLQTPALQGGSLHVFPATIQDPEETPEQEATGQPQSEVGQVEVVESLPEGLVDQGPFERPFLLEITGPIDASTLRYARVAIRQAQDLRADLVVVKIDSPGGGAAESMEIADMLAQIQWGQTVAFISREATSGGAMIALGCQWIVMQPGTTMGDIGVIQLDPSVWAFRYAPAKIRSVLVAKARALAERHGRSPELAEAMVDEYAAVYQNEEDPTQFKLVSLGSPEELGEKAGGDALVAEPSLPGGWVLVPETRPGRFLTLPPGRAQDLGISQGVSPSLESFQQSLPIRGVWTVRLYGFTDRIVDFLNLFWISLLLLAIGIIALFIEMASPGISVGGLVAFVCFSLFFWSHFMGGTAGWLEVILFLSGVVCLLAELFLIPGFGVAGLMGIALVLLSLVMATLDFVYPTTSVQWTQLSHGLLTVTLATIVGGAGIGWVMRHMGSLPALQRLTLEPPQWDPVSAPKSKSTDVGPVQAIVPMVDSGRAAGLKVGDKGVSESVLRPAGRARIEGRSVDVVADGKFIEPGMPIQVIDVRGNRLVVVPQDSNTTNQRNEPGPQDEGTRS